MTLKIKIPDDGNLLIKAGDEIKFDQPFFEKNIEEKVTINLAERLTIKPEKIFKFLKKFVGDSVNKNELIALKKDLFSTKKVFSPVDGEIKEIDHQQGTVIIETKTGKKNLITADFQGQVATIKKDFFELKVKKILSIPTKETFNSFGGQCLYLEDNLDNQLINLTSNEVAKKIIITSSLNEIQATKLEVLDAKAFIFNKPNSLSLEKKFFVKNLDFWQKIIKEKLPYCYFNSFSSTIDFYQ